MGESRNVAVGEDTIIRTLDLPEGQDYAWYPDLNVVALSSRLDCEGRLRAFNDLQSWWRREHLTAVKSA